MSRNPRAHELRWRVLGRSGFKGASAGRHLALPFTFRVIERLCWQIGQQPAYEPGPQPRWKK